MSERDGQFPKVCGARGSWADGLKERVHDWLYHHLGDRDEVSDELWGQVADLHYTERQDEAIALIMEHTMTEA